MQPNPNRNRARGTRLSGLLFVAALLAAAPAFAQDPVVTAADPDMAEQETYDLVVKISGSNFGVDSEVDFLVTGSETDTGGITVRNVKRRNPKTLEVTIDVAPDAQFQKKFDIRVRTNGRTGKGTELFRVIEKTNNGGGDTTPPGEVSDLSVEAVDLGNVVVGFSATPDDGYDPASGPAAKYLVKVRFDDPFTPETWEHETLPGLGFTISPVNTEPWPGPGNRVSARILGLVPSTEYWAAVRAYDEVDNASGISQVGFETPAAPASSWVTEVADAGCAAGTTPGLSAIDVEVDPSGAPAILYSKRCEADGSTNWLYLARRTAAGWTSEALGLGTLDGRWEDLAFDPVTGEPTLAHSGMKLYLYRQSGGGWTAETLERSQAGAVSLAYAGGQPTVAYKRGSSIRVARKNGTRWDKTEFPLPTSQNTLFGTLHLVFDDFANPAVAYGMDRDGNASAEIVQVALWTGTDWRLERVDETEPGCLVSSVSLAWDPHRADFSLAYDAGCSRAPVPGGRIRTCDRNGDDSWTCQTLPIDPDRWPWIETSALVFGSSGQAFLFLAVDTSIVLSTTRAPGTTTWSELEYVAPDVPPQVALDPIADDPVLATTAGMEWWSPAEVRFLWRQP